MSDETTEIQSLLKTNSECLAYIAWVKQTIATTRYEIQLPPKPWAGRDDIIELGCRHFKTSDRLLIAQCVDVAVTELGVVDEADSTGRQVQLMVLRLKVLHQHLFSQMDKGSSQKTYKYFSAKELRASDLLPEKYEDAPDSKFIRIPFKESRSKGIDPALVGQMLQLERLIADLTGLFRSEGPQSNIVQMLFAHFKDDKPKEDKNASMARKDQDQDIDHLNDSMQLKILEQLCLPVVEPVEKAKRGRGRPRKIVESTPVEDEVRIGDF